MTPKRNYIAFSLWGDNPIYTIGAIRNVELAPKIYKGWDVIIYHDKSVSQEIMEELNTLNVQLVDMSDSDIPGYFWRFLAADIEDCDAAIFRDTDSRLSQREYSAVQEWINSGKDIHVMRDHPYHEIPFGASGQAILAGMWGIRGNLFRMEDFIREFVHGKETVYGIDQAFLEQIYFRFKDSRVVHDDFFDKKPFPTKRKGVRFVGERIGPYENPIGEDWKFVQQHQEQYNTCFFSIIIPTYNSQHTIAECVDSVLRQSFTDFEIIVQDGQSKDDTIAVIEQFDDDRITIYSEADQGVYDAMNKAVERSYGQWVYFLGSDDSLYQDDVLEKVAQKLKSDPAKVLYGDVKVIGDEEGILTKSNGLYRGYTPVEELVYENICHQAIFYDASLFKKDKYSYDLRYPIGADHMLNLKLASLFPLVYVPIIVANFTVGGLSTTRTIDYNFENDRWINIIRYYGKTLIDPRFYRYKSEIRITAKKLYKEKRFALAFKSLGIYLLLKLKKSKAK